MKYITQEQALSMELFGLMDTEGTSQYPVERAIYVSSVLSGILYGQLPTFLSYDDEKAYPC